jgi:hypothetical protein
VDKEIRQRATFENIKENDFCEKPASFEDKVCDVVVPVSGVRCAERTRGCDSRNEVTRAIESYARLL